MKVIKCSHTQYALWKLIPITFHKCKAIAEIFVLYNIIYNMVCNNVV